MSKLWLLLFLAACGAKAPPPSNEPPPPDQGSATPPTEPTGQICGTRGVGPCPDNMFCSFEPGADCGEADRPGRCMAPPEACIQIYKPVCGCDGKTYGNDCAAAMARVGVRAEGECK